MAGFEKAIALHIGDLRRYASVLLRNAGEVDDLVQDCLMHAVSRRPAWRHIRDPRAYLFAVLSVRGIAQRLCRFTAGSKAALG